jgi:CheY-like chemotaxis protein
MDTRKVCTCGRRFTGESWSALRLLGTMDNGRKIGELLELRLCPCGTSLAVPIGTHSPSLVPSSIPTNRTTARREPSSTILLVDDDDAIAESVRDVLTDEGYDVRRAVDGKEALALVRGGLRPELILLDLMMPIMDGYEFRARQLEDQALASIPVVVLSAYDVTPVLGAVHALRKPFTLDALLTTVRRALGVAA